MSGFAVSFRSVSSFVSIFRFSSGVSTDGFKFSRFAKPVCCKNRGFSHVVSELLGFSRPIQGFRVFDFSDFFVKFRLG